MLFQEIWLQETNPILKRNEFVQKDLQKSKIEKV